MTTWSARRPYLSQPPAWATDGAQGGAPGAPVKILATDDVNSTNTSTSTRTVTKAFYMMTFQAEEKDCRRQVCTCVGAAFAPHPSQPFVPGDKPVMIRNKKRAATVSRTHISCRCTSAACPRPPTNADTADLPIYGLCSAFCAGVHRVRFTRPVTCMPQLDGAIDASPRRLAAANGGGLALYWKSTGFNTLVR